MKLDDEQAKFNRFIQQRDAGPPNDSGTGVAAQLPAELRGLNWGGLLMNFIWAVAMKLPFIYILLLFVPFVGMAMPFVMLFKGNEWAWQYRKWESVEHFRRVQEKWALWGFILLVLTFILSMLLAELLNRMMRGMLTV